MGACNSSSPGGVVQGLERNCARGIRGRRGRSSSTSSSSSTSLSSSPAPTRRASQIPEAADNQEAGNKALTAADEASDQTAVNYATSSIKSANSKVAKEALTEQQPPPSPLTRHGSSKFGATTTATTATSISTPTSSDKDALEGAKQSATNGDLKENQTPAEQEKSETELLKRRERLDKLKEGVDFIETEEDAEAVESAVVKIQSTFRGKKIRSKLGGKQPATTPTTAKISNSESTINSAEASDSKQKPDSSTNTKKPAESSATTAAASKKPAAADEELNKRVAKMQVNDNSDAHEAQKGNNHPALPEDEAERAATKIQAGFKGYKTRKELEGKLGGQQAAGQAPGSQQQAPPTGAQQPAASRE